MTTSEARLLVKSEPKRWRAAFVEAPGTPLLDHPQARVRLHPTVGAAHDELRARKESLVKQGYAVTFGTLGKSFLLLERENDKRAIAVNKPQRAKRG